jgi:hypothetical protein
MSSLCNPLPQTLSNFPRKTPQVWGWSTATKGMIHLAGRSQLALGISGPAEYHWYRRQKGEVSLQAGGSDCLASVQRNQFLISPKTCGWEVEDLCLFKGLMMLAEESLWEGCVLRARCLMFFATNFWHSRGEKFSGEGIIHAR